MKQTIKTILLLTLLSSNMMNSFADRGVRKKAKNKVLLNISTNKSFKSDLAYNLKSGLNFKNTLYLGNNLEKNILMAHSISTYQKGNTLYIIQNKRKIIIPEVKQGYTGFKLIIKANK